MRLNQNCGTYMTFSRVKWLNNLIDPILVIVTDSLMGRVTLELKDEKEFLNKSREEQKWCFAPVSKT